MSVSHLFDTVSGRLLQPQDEAACEAYVIEAKQFVGASATR